MKKLKVDRQRPRERNLEKKRIQISYCLEMLLFHRINIPHLLCYRYIDEIRSKNLKYMYNTLLKYPQ